MWSGISATSYILHVRVRLLLEYVSFNNANPAPSQRVEEEESATATAVD